MNVDLTASLKPKPTGLRSWRVARMLVLAVATFLHGWKLGSSGWTNPYYTAVIETGLTNGIRSVLASEMDLFGFLTLEKPPLPQLASYLSAVVLGFEPWVLLLPYAIAGVASVFLIMATVRRFGSEALAVLTGGLLVLVPAVSTTFRTNQVEAFDLLGRSLMLYGAVRGVQALTNGMPSRRWWAVSMLGVFIAANAKMTMVAPLVAVLIVVLTTQPGIVGRVKRRVMAAYTTITAVSVMAWPVWFDVFSGSKAFAGSSPDGTALGNVVYQNFVLRLPFTQPPGYFFGDPGYARASWWRLFGEKYVDEWAWWAPLTLTGVVVAVVHMIAWKRRRDSGAPEVGGRLRGVLRGSSLGGTGVVFTPVLRFGVGVLLGWFFVYWVVASFSATTVCCLHAYYLSTYAPPVAFFTAYAFMVIGHRWRVALSFVTVLWAAWLFSAGADDVMASQLSGRVPAAALLVVFATVAIGAATASALGRRGRFSSGAALVAIAVFAAAVTSMSTVLPRTSPIDGDPRSGRGLPTWTWSPWIERQVPYQPWSDGPSFTAGASPFTAEEVLPSIRELLAEPAQRWSAATLRSFNAAAFSVAAGAPVMPYGGTNGFDEIVTLEDFQRMVVAGDVRYGLVSWVDLCVVESTERFRFTTGHEPSRILFWLLRNGIPVEYGTRTARAGTDPTLVSERAVNWQPLVFRLDPAGAAADIADGNRWSEREPAVLPFLSSC